MIYLVLIFMAVIAVAPGPNAFIALVVLSLLAAALFREKAR